MHCMENWSAWNPEYWSIFLGWKSGDMIEYNQGSLLLLLLCWIEEGTILNSYIY